MILSCDDWVTVKNRVFYSQCFLKVEKIWQKCVNSDGSFIEKEQTLYIISVLCLMPFMVRSKTVFKPLLLWTLNDVFVYLGILARPRLKSYQEILWEAKAAKVILKSPRIGYKLVLSFEAITVYTWKWVPCYFTVPLYMYRNKHGSNRQKIIN